jgi:hydrogenase maturation protein HypF
LPDLATCPDCLAELFDPENWRYRYPFTNCTHCGPRYSIIEAIPYDRPNTSMRRFRMCPTCQREYDDPNDRRFHAQPNACPVCGPHVELWCSSGEVLATHEEALRAAVSSVRAGKIVAVKGIGGFHLVVDARDDEAVRRLRLRKYREEKPLAVMMPSMEQIAVECYLSEDEKRLLCSSAAPIVLLHKRNNTAGGKSPTVSPPTIPASASCFPTRPFIIYCCAI